ncbi:hypothetical protein J5N97_021813 [Dioscorea zingiberensis]|uniref:RING-type E3 ubiquitin transferase n=1 Tax=Dioscorea zingiberensis TaxID=325984 RepID=A0A9D5C932_9LILI|nr:hypothetical protein J5N97_021813 [Dioscorea zingiberensis]
MLQIRLSKTPSGDSGAGTAVTRPPPPSETVTVACPDHLVIADLPVAKSLGAITSSAAPALRSLGRRSRRLPGDRVHFCVRCDFPIAIYGRLIPCEHVFCLACARSDSICYLCDERIQKIQTIKMMEGIFVCGAPHCLKSFLKKSEFESHIHETHADLLQLNVEKGMSDADASNTMRLSLDSYKQSSQQPESSTARAPPRPAFSPNSDFQVQDLDERARRYPSRDQQSAKPLLQPKLSPFPGRPPYQPSDQQQDNNPPQGFDKPQNWFNQGQGFENQSNFQYPPTDKQTGMPQESPIPTYPPLQPLQQPNFQLPLNANQAPPATPSYNYPLPAEGLQPYYNAPYDMLRPESMPQSGSDQGSVLGFPPSQPAGLASFPEGYPRPWGMGFMNVPFNSLPIGQGIPEGFANPTDSHGSSAEQNDGKGVLASMPPQMPLSMPLPPPPPLPPPILQQLNRGGGFSSSHNVNQDGQGY